MTFELKGTANRDNFVLGRAGLVYSSLHDPSHEHPSWILGLTPQQDAISLPGTIRDYLMRPTSLPYAVGGYAKGSPALGIYFTNRNERVARESAWGRQYGNEISLIAYLVQPKDLLFDPWIQSLGLRLDSEVNATIDAYNLSYQQIHGGTFAASNYYTEALRQLFLFDGSGAPQRSSLAGDVRVLNAAESASLESQSKSISNKYAANLIVGYLTGDSHVFNRNSFDYKFYNLGSSRYGIQEKGETKIDDITGTSSLKFKDQTLNLTTDISSTFNLVRGIDDVSGVIFRLYNAAFSRLPDAKGLENWINGNVSGNVNYASSAQSFSQSEEFKNRYGHNVTDAQFITTLYSNVLGRAPDTNGLNHYLTLLAGGRTRGELLLDFSESPENRILFAEITGL